MKHYPKVIATDGKAVVVENLNKLPKSLTLFNNLDKVSYKLLGERELTEVELQELFDEFKINCIIV